MHITLTSAQSKDLGELFEYEDSLELDGFTYILHEESDEINDLKHVLWDRIYQRNDDKYFRQNCSKSGSYWSDYEFDYGERLTEVKLVEVIKKAWKAVD